MENKIVKEILELDRKIDNIILKGTSYFEPGKTKKLNDYDNKILEYYERILDLIIELSSEEKEKRIETIDKRYFKTENTASMFIKDYIEMLQFYRNLDERIIKTEIEVITKIQENLELNNESEMNNKIELADCYFQGGNENKARELILGLIKEYPNEDEVYQCMQNWYMYDSPDINKLAEVIDLAEENEHILITDFGYDRLVQFYDNIGDTKNKQKYQELYDKWKSKIDIIEF